MSAAHQDPLYAKNSRILRKRYNADHAAGRPVPCQRCGRLIAPGAKYDIGHRIDVSRGGDHSMQNLGPEHRTRTAHCQGNRSAGGRLGAAVTNTRSRKARGLPTW